MLKIPMISQDLFVQMDAALGYRIKELRLDEIYSFYSLSFSIGFLYKER